MPLRLEIKKKLTASSDRVKSVDIHPTEPWVLAALYSGHLFIWNYQTSALVKSIEVCELPVRVAKFIPRKQWIVCGADDMHIRIYNYNTTERIKSFEAHADYIRSIAVHPSLPYVLSSSDDMTIKLWDWEKNWDCTHTYEGHNHYVMQVEFNPKDPTTFASASLDRTIKVWGVNSTTPHFSLEGHERGVNCISYFSGGEKPFLVSGADDQLIKVWDYQTKSCVATLEGHTNNVSSVYFHPQLPIIISGSEDGTVRVWHSTTYRLENTLNYGMERVWALSCLHGSNKVAIGYDDGTIMVKLGHEDAVISMDKAGKVVWAKNHEVISAHVKTAADEQIADGERLTLATKELGSCEIYPQSMEHSPNGRFLVICGDGEYIVYTALALKNKSFGSGLEFVWGAGDSGTYATRESTSRIKVFKNFKEHKSIRPPFAAEGIFGGTLLGVRSNEFIDFYEWNEMRLVRRIAVCPRKVFWSTSGELVVLACESSFYILRYNNELVEKYFEQGIEISEQGIEDAFELEQEVSEKVRSGHFVGDCFIYNNSAGRLNYFVGGQTITLAHLDRPMYVLGYLMKENRVYLTDKQNNIISYQLLLSLLAYQTAIVRRDLEAAEGHLANIPREHHNKLAHFLEAQDLKELALQVSNDPEHKFELALQLKRLELAHEVLLESESEQKWKQLGDLALAEFDLKLAERCFVSADDLSSLLLIHSSTGNVDGMKELAQRASTTGRYNISFIAHFLTQQIDACVQLLLDTNRIPEAAFLARTYAPSQIPRVVELWRENLKKVSQRAAQSLADPSDYPDLFTDLRTALSVERWVRQNKRVLPAQYYQDVRGDLYRNLIEEAKAGALEQSVPEISEHESEDMGAPASAPAPASSPAPQPASGEIMDEAEVDELVADLEQDAELNGQAIEELEGNIDEEEFDRS